MRSRAPVALLACLAGCFATPAVASAATDGLMPYSAEVTADEAATLMSQGFDIHESGFHPGEAKVQEVQIIASGEQKAELAQEGIELEPLAIDKPTQKSAALGDSPNPFFNVYRSYMEPGGIKDEMIALANANPDVMKLIQIGTSTLGKPIYVIKMTANARNVPDGSRPAVLFSSINHAREWIAAEMGRRLPIWFADHKNDTKIKELIATRELWFLPIQNPDGYDYTFTCGVGISSNPANNRAVPCDYRTAGSTSSQVINRFWRKTLRDNDGDGIYGEPNQDGVDPNRNYPAKRGIDEEGASNSFGSETYRGPYALSEPENLAVDRLQRRVRFTANINYHSAGQLLLTPVSYTTDYYPPDSTLFDAITGTDGDEAVFPYRSQHSSDLYESNGDTIDNAYMNYGIIGWTPEMDTCATLGEPQGCNQFASPDDEATVQAVFNKNLAFALNVTNSLPNMGRPKNFDNDPSQYQVKPTQDIQPTRFDVSYGSVQPLEAVVRKELGTVKARVVLSTPGNIPNKQNTQVTVPMTTAPAGERYGEVPGYYFERVSGKTPEIFPEVRNNQGVVTSPARPAAPGDIVTVTILAGGIQQEFNYRIEDVHNDTTKKRVLVVAAEDYKGKSPNVTAGYDTAPRYLDEHKAALEAAGYEVEVFDIDNPPANGGSPNPVVRPQIKYPTNIGVLSHFDAVNYYSGDDFGPQDVTETNVARPTGVTTQTPAINAGKEMSSWAHKVMLELREYANTGGKLIVDGRNVHQPFTSYSASLSATGPWNWTPDKLFGFFYPPNNEGDDDLPGTAWQRSRASSNDTWQNYLGVIGRQSGIGVATSTSPSSNNNNPAIAGYAVAAKPGGLFAGMGPIAINEDSANEPTQAADGSPLPQPRLASRLRNWGPSNEPLRAERVEADYATPVTYETSGGAIISTRDAVTFGFGLEQVDQATRNELVKRSLAYLLPTTPDTTAPTIVGFKYPTNLSTATPRDPVDIELTTFDERGDMDYVDLKVGGQLVQRTEVYPFQFRWTPPASAVGSVVKLTAEAVDSAGNKSTRDLYVNVLAGDAPPASPVAIAPPTLLGTPTVGSQLSCISGGFTNQPTDLDYAWLRNGAVIAGAIQPTYTLTADDLGRSVACKITASNDAGSGDATSESVVVSNPTPAFTATPEPVSLGTTTTSSTTTTTKTTTVTYIAACALASSGKSISCTVSSTPASTKFTATVRLQGKKTATKSTKSKSGKVKLTLRSSKRLKKGQKVVLTIKSGKTTKVITAKAGSASKR
jgi:hypothetical protein